MNTQDFIVRVAASLRVGSAIACGAERLALVLSQQTATENAKAHAQLKAWVFRFPRTACAGASRSSSETSTGRGASTSHFSTATRELDAADPGPLHHRWGRTHCQLRDHPRPVRPRPDPRGLARAGPPEEPARRLKREQQSTGVPRPASEPPTRRPSALPQNARACALLRCRKATAPAIRHGSTRRASR